MKNLFKVILVAAAATTLFACNNGIENEIPLDTNPVVRTVQFSAGEITRTVFGTPSGNSVPTLWTENKTVGISLNFATAKESTAPHIENGGATATFSAEIADSGSSPYTFYAVSPYSSVISANSSYCSVQVDIPASQTPLANSVDENAQILVAKHSAGSTFPTSSVLMDFDHLTAYGKISFSNLALASGESIVSVSLTAAEDWVGRYYYYFEDHSPYSEGDIAANSVGKTLTLTTSSDTDIWFACAPVDLGGKIVKVVITTNQATTYTKNITIPAGKTFASGKVNAFTINMNGITADGAAKYELVKNPADLTVGSSVIIAAPGDIAFAMSTTQNGNNRGSTSVTKTQDNTFISSPSEAVQIFTIDAGTKDNTIAFNTGVGYIFAASSGSNYLRTEENLSDNSSWTVSIDSEGVATVIAQGSNTRNHLRYNGTSTPPVFACYGSSSSVETKVSLYILAANWELDNIAVTTSPTKTEYVAGENFDPTGMVVTAHYVDADDNTHTKDVVLSNADLTISPSTNLTAGTTSVSISYGGKSTTQAITVTAPITWDLKSIAVTTAPTKVTYTEGEFFDPTGMVVTATYENHNNTEQTKTETVDIGDLTFLPTTSTALTTSDNAITITFNSKSTTQAITVNAAPSEYYELVSTEANVVAGKYVITWDNTYYLPNTTSNKNPAVGSGITVSGNRLTNTVTDEMVWTFTGDNTDGFAITAGNNRLHATNTAQGISVNTTSTVKWTASVNENYGMLLQGDDGGSRSLAVYDNATWRYYAIGSNYTGELRLYKLVDNTVWNLTDIAVTTPPTKTTYVAGECFDPTGMVVTATYADQAGVKPNKTETVSINDLTFSPALTVGLTVETTSISISYNGQTTTQSITVTAPITWDLRSIAVTTPPTKTTYNAGQFFDPSGMEVTATYENHDNTTQTKQEVIPNSSLSFSPSTSTALQTTDVAITISYNGKSTSQSITVNSTTSEVEVTFTVGVETGSNSLSKEGVEITTTSGTFSRTDNYRIYANNSMTVTAPSGKTLKSIVCTITQNDFANPTAGTWDSSTKTWSKGSNSPNSVTLSASGGQVRITKIVVTYE